MNKRQKKKAITKARRGRGGLVHSQLIYVRWYIVKKISKLKTLDGILGGMIQGTIDSDLLFIGYCQLEAVFCYYWDRLNEFERKAFLYDHGIEYQEWMKWGKLLLLDISVKGIKENG